jgi:hypothetical protein
MGCRSYCKHYHEYVGSGVYQNLNQGSRSSNAGSGGGVSQLAGGVVNYANSGASLNGDASFAAALGSVNAYNNSLSMPWLFGPTGGVTTRSTIR